MNEKKECKIVQDLLPNYIEKVTVEETNNYIENHLKTCEECHKIYSSMTESLNAKPTVEEKEVRYMKRFHKQLKVLKIILLVIVLFFVFSIGRKTYILCSLGAKWEKTDQQLSNNYFARTLQYMDGIIIETTSYLKEQDYITTINYMSTNGHKSKMTHYKKGEEELYLLETKDKKFQFEGESFLRYHPGISFNTTAYFIGNLQHAPFVKIETLNIDDKECYVIKYSNEDRIIDKETGIEIKTIHYGYNDITTIENYYDFGVVKDSDIQRPDTTGYKVIRDASELQEYLH